MATRSKKAKSEIVVRDPVESLEFKKSNDAIGLRVKKGSLSLISRKAFNVMIHHAQEVKVPGLNAPVDINGSSGMFWMPLSQVVRNSAYNSNDIKHFIKVLKELRSVELEEETERSFFSSSLVSAVSVIDAGNSKNGTGQTWLGYEFPKAVLEHVMSPTTYTRFSMIYQSSLKSGAALALYEICRRFATNPSKVTSVQDLDWWYSALTGNPIPQEGIPQYKYFKRDTIKTAVAEVNSLTDITVELIEHKSGRSVSHLQFSVQLTKNPQLEFPAPPVLDTDLIAQIMRFGFSESDATDLTVKFRDDDLRMAIARADVRVRSTTLDPVTSPAGYFRWLIKSITKENSGGALGSAPKLSGSTKREKEPVNVMDQFTAARSAEAFEAYSELEDFERKEVYDTFKSENQGSGLNLDKGLEAGSVRSLFSVWYATKLWGEPTVESLAHFIERK